MITDRLSSPYSTHFLRQKYCEMKGHIVIGSPLGAPWKRLKGIARNDMW
jgi:hypothetical protein